MNQKSHIAIVGTFDTKNFGDLLFPELAKVYLAGDFTIDLFSPNGGIKPFTKNEKVYPISKLEERCRKYKYKAIIIGGGDIIRFDYNIASDYQHEATPAMSLWVVPILVGRALGIPVLFNTPGVPFRFNLNERPYTKDLLSMLSYLSIRDDTSCSLLQECGISTKSIKVVPDSLFRIDKYIEQFDLEGIYRKICRNDHSLRFENFIVVQHNSGLSDETAAILREQLEQIIAQSDYNILLFPIGYVHRDIDALEKVYQKDNQRMSLCRKEYSPLEILAVLYHSAGYIGTSMHGGIISWVFGKPIIALDQGGTATKIAGYQKQIGGLTSLSDYSQLFSKFDDIFLHKHISFDKKAKIDQQIDQHFKEIRAIISAGDISTDKTAMDRILNNISDSLRDSSTAFRPEIIVNYNYGDGFHIYNRRVIPITNLDNVDFTVDTSPDMQEIIIVVTNADCLAVRDFSISPIEGTEYEIPNQMGSNTDFTIFGGFKIGLKHLSHSAIHIHFKILPLVGDTLSETIKESYIRNRELYDGQLELRKIQNRWYRRIYRKIAAHIKRK